MTKKDDLAEKLKKAQAEADAEKEEFEETEAEGHAGVPQKRAGEELEDTGSLEQQLADMTEMAKRTMADLQNLKRRNEEERATIFKMASADLIRNLLPILDNLDRAKEHAPEGVDDWMKGINMSIDQLHKTLQDTGLTEMEAQDQDFDPDKHEALLQCSGPENKVVEVLEKGYMMGEQVIRHAKVKVGDGS